VTFSGRLLRASSLRVTGLLVGLVVGLLLGVLIGAAPATAYTEAPEDYASYQPEDACRDRPRPGTKALATWINKSFGGGTAVASLRRCDRSTSEHQDGRAIDWSMDATRKADRREVRRFLEALFVADEDGEEHALARRMGIMYLIWNDGMYSSYTSGGADHFGRRDYGCGCGSKTARHRDHVHISLGLRGGRGLTSWYTEKP
jgi:hypothetical protein